MAQVPLCLSECFLEFSVGMITPAALLNCRVVLLIEGVVLLIEAEVLLGQFLEFVIEFANELQACGAFRITMVLCLLELLGVVLVLGMAWSARWAGIYRFEARKQSPRRLPLLPVRSENEKITDTDLSTVAGHSFNIPFVEYPWRGRWGKEIE